MKLMKELIFVNNDHYIYFYIIIITYLTKLLLPIKLIKINLIKIKDFYTNKSKQN